MIKGIFKKFLICFFIICLIFVNNINLVVFAANMPPDMAEGETVEDLDNPEDSDDSTPTPDTPPYTPPDTPDIPDTPPSDTTPSDSTPEPEPEAPTTFSISGKVWEDNKSTVNEFGISKGDGIYQEGENLIEGITVNLYKEGNDEIIQNTSTTSDGSYTFNNVEKGEYKVEFVYGEKNLKYNGQDYKSSIAYEIPDIEESPTQPQTPTTNSGKRDIVFIIDLSGSMAGYISDMQASLNKLIPELLDGNTNISIFTYDTNTYVKQCCKFSNNSEELLAQISSFSSGGATNTIDGLREANQYLDTDSKSDAVKYIILFTDGAPNDSSTISYDEYTYRAENGQLKFIDDTHEQDYYEEVRNECKNYWENSITENKLAFCFGPSPYFNDLFGESGNFVQLTDGSKLSDSFHDSVSDFTSNSPTTITTSEEYNYAIDDPYRRLDIMQNSMYIDYNNNESILNTSMSAITPSFNLTSGTPNINFALEERPKSSVEVTKNVSHLKIILSDGNTLIDWEPGRDAKHLMVLPDSLTVIMDDELVHGAKVEIQYQIQIKNTSEKDNLSNYFTEEFLVEAANDPKYSEWLDLFNRTFGTSDVVGKIDDIVPTKYCIYDYLDNSMFDKDNSDEHWEVVSNPKTINSNTASGIGSILERRDLKETFFLPNSSLLSPLKLSSSKLMTITDTDLLTYNNYVEVIEYSSILGRRMYNIVPGNLDIYDEERTQIHKLESDEAKAETVTRVPPFGKNLSYYTTLIGIIILAIEITVLGTLKVKIKNLRKDYIRK